MDTNSIFQSMYDWSISASIRESANAFPAIESFHVIAITLVFGTILIVDLRLLGVMSHRKSAKQLIDELLPYTWGGFAVAVVTGALLFISNAVSYVNNTEFLLKLSAIALAGLNMMWFHSTAFRKIGEWDVSLPTPNAARMAGFSSLIVWTSVIFLGRWIGFTLETIF